MGRKKKKGIDLEEYANAASAQVLTYGQKQALDYQQEHFKRASIPEGYSKISDRKK